MSEKCSLCPSPLFDRPVSADTEPYKISGKPVCRKCYYEKLGEVVEGRVDEVEELLKAEIPNWKLTFTSPDLISIISPDLISIISPDLIEYTHKDGIYFVAIKELPVVVVDGNTDKEFKWTAEVWRHPYGADDPYTEFYTNIGDVVSLESAIKISHDWMREHPSVEKKYARLVWEEEIPDNPTEADMEIVLDRLIEMIESTIGDHISIDDIEICDTPYEVTGERFHE